MLKVFFLNDILLWSFISCPNRQPTRHNDSEFKYCTRIYSNQGSLRIWANVSKASLEENLLVGADISQFYMDTDKAIWEPLSPLSDLEFPPEIPLSATPH